MRNLYRTLHDAGLFAWFGGSLMGNVGVNGASREVADPGDRVTVANAGWARYNPVQALAVASYVAGAVGMIRNDPDSRPSRQPGILANDVLKITLSVSAAAFSVASALLGRKVAAATAAAAVGDGYAPVDAATTPSEGTPPDAAEAQRRLALVQWGVPLATAGAIVLSARRGELERPQGVLKSLLKRTKL
jgi:hypothetical protein